MSEASDQMIELTIEALTGTVYDLCVSPFETILGIKMKIQRLEGIPVYQQQLVHENTELHDEFCLEEYSIGSGAQLKLLVAMRGGPIHAHRVQLEDPTLLEIAEVLEVQDSEHKYTVMLLRDEDVFEMGEFVEVVAEESPGHVSPLPQATSTEQETASSIALSKATHTKMQDLMSRLRSRKPSSMEDGDNSSQLHRRGTSTTKVFILNSRSSSRLLHSSAPSPVTPHSAATPTNTNIQSTVHRKLVFPAKAGACSGEKGSPRHKTTTEQRVGPGASCSHHHQNERQARGWRRQRLRRPSCLTDKPIKHNTKDVGELAKEMTQLRLRETGGGQPNKKGITERPLLPKLPSSSSSFPSRTPNLNSGVPRLPQISGSHAPCLTGSGRSHHQTARPQCTHCGKKVGLASTYTCRCGSVFCSRHRYAESHNCSYDYKSHGRETIARGNPLVVAPKLPKI